MRPPSFAELAAQFAHDDLELGERVALYQLNETVTAIGPHGLARLLIDATIWTSPDPGVARRASPKTLAHEFRRRGGIWA